MKGVNGIVSKEEFSSTLRDLWSARVGKIEFLVVTAYNWFAFTGASSARASIGEHSMCGIIFASISLKARQKQEKQPYHGTKLRQE